MPIILNNYDDVFEKAWDIYKQTHAKLILLSERMGIRKDKVYIAPNIGSKETAYIKWNYLLTEVILVDEPIDSQLLLESVALFCHDRTTETTKGAYRLPMLATFLRTDNPDPNKPVEIIDYIREAKRLTEKIKESYNA